MKSALNVAKCPNCGNALPKGGLAGLCPACLLDAGSVTETAEAPVSKGFEPPRLEELEGLFPNLAILQLIGAGGMGAVYKARQPALDRLVALKILPRGSSEGVNFAERFNREARALARLSHPNIVTVHEFGHVQGLHFFIMEYVDGANLRQLEQAGRLSPREALQLIPQICDALQYAHDEGVVHRDIKPENVLVDRKGRVKIADFGLAKILGVDADKMRLTAEGQVMGTPHYMAPEQLERPLAVDHRADIYSLGVVFYEMLTGDLPLGKFPPPSRKVTVDVRLDEVVLRALENDPARRYQQASEVKSELHTISESPAPPTTSNASPATTTKPVERFIYWAGIPLVVDRDGEREVSWDGGLTALGVGFILTSLGLYLFHLVTGRPSPEFLGFPSLITIFILGAGFRWAMNAPLEEDQEKVLAENGTVVMTRPRRRWGWSVLAMGSILVAVFAWGVFKDYLLPSIVRPLRGLPSVPIAKRDPASGILSISLPGRGKAELLAVAYRDPAPNQWWRPDGTLITNELFQIENPGECSSHLTTNRDVVLRMIDLPDGASGPSFDVRPSGGYTSGASILRNGTPLPGACGMRMGISPELKSVDLRMGLGLELWRTIATHFPKKQSGSTESRPGDPRWDVQFNSVSETIKGTQVTVVMAAENRDWNRRIVALDLENKEHSYALGKGTPGKETSTWTYTFDKLPLTEVLELRIQVQPLHWVEFRNIRLNTNRSLPPAEPVAFGPVQEVSLSEYIDLDTGKVMEEPPSKSPSANIFEGFGETVAWMERTGLDAAAGNGELQPLGMIFVALEQDQWNSVTPSELTNLLRQGAFRPASLKPWKNGELPSTFGFRTREGGTGVLQLLTFEEARPGVTMRFKLLKWPAQPTP